MRYNAWARIGSDLLNSEQHIALADAGEQVEADADTGTGERYIRYVQVIVGLRSLN